VVTVLTWWNGQLSSRMENGLTAQPDATESEVAVPESSTTYREMANVWGYDPDMDFRKLALEAQYRSKGFRLVQKAMLVGVPFVVVGVTYRPGFPRAGQQGDYVSVECVVADKETLNTAPVRSMLPADLEVYGNEPVVFNDSGTGVRRDLTMHFQGMGLIDVGMAKKDENAFDRQYQQWASGADVATTGIVADANGEKFRYLAMRGLRRSDYENEYGPATTFYFG
jgi:hypothetical protein